MVNKELVDAAVTEGSVKTEQDEVTVGAKSSPDGKEHKRPYTRFTALNAKGMAALCNGKIVPATSKPAEGTKDERTDADKAVGACDYFNYGFDLDIRASERAILMGELEGPEKAIAKVVKALVDGGLFNETEAKDYVITQRKAKGLPV
jgi:hypothetical protein